MKSKVLPLVLLLISQMLVAQNLDSLLQIRGLCIAAPTVEDLSRFNQFITNDLAPKGYNTLVLRIDYNYAYESYPNLQDENPLTKENIKAIVKTARDNGIRLIPQVNLLGHQSWAEEEENLLKEYPEFDETPGVKMPAVYEWPNNDGLYCKSYCPLHPRVHEVVFAIVDEIIEVFETDAFHAGMDEVFYIGDDKCPRCSGKNKAELFANEVSTIRDHLSAQGVKLWIWGDRLLDGKETGLGMWEASENDTHQAIDIIPKDVVINDWHYEYPEPTAAYFALKGLNVISCPWRKPHVAEGQVDMMLALKAASNPKVQPRYMGVMQTIWTSAKNFLDLYYGVSQNADGMGQVDSFNALANRFNTL